MTPSCFALAISALTLAIASSLLGGVRFVFVFFEFAINAHPHSCDLTARPVRTAHPIHYIQPGTVWQPVFRVFSMKICKRRPCQKVLLTRSQTENAAPVFRLKILRAAARRICLQTAHKFCTCGTGRFARRSRRRAKPIGILIRARGCRCCEAGACVLRSP